MKRDRAALAVALAGALLFIDANSILAFARSDILQQATSLELLVFSIQVAKALAVLGVKRLRESSPAFIIDVFGADFLLIAALVVTQLFTGVAALASLSDQLLMGWIAGVAIAGLPYAAYRLGRSMLRSGSPSSLLPTAVVVAELSVLFANAASSAATSNAGLAGVSSLTFSGRGTALSGSTAVFVALAAVYVSLLLYTVTGMDTGLSINRNRALGFAILGTTASAALAASTPSLSLPLTLAYLPPTVAVVTVSWWLTRAR